jgi:hypothetical protein
MTEYKVTIGVREIKVVADTESEASSQAIAKLNDNIAWVQVAKVEPRQTGFRYEPPQPEPAA